MTWRFVVTKRHVNKQTLTLKADAFVPHPYEELSVTRLIEITEDEIWTVGRNVATARTPPRTLRGRGDVLAATYLRQENLRVVADPVQGQPQSRQRHRMALGRRRNRADHDRQGNRRSGEVCPTAGVRVMTVARHASRQGKAMDWTKRLEPSESWVIFAKSQWGPRRADTPITVMESDECC